MGDLYFDDGSFDPTGMSRFGSAVAIRLPWLVVHGVHAYLVVFDSRCEAGIAASRMSRHAHVHICMHASVHARCQ